MGFNSGFRGLKPDDPTHMEVAGWWVQLSNNAASESVNYDHSLQPFLGFFPWVLLTFYKTLYQKIKS